MADTNELTPFEWSMIQGTQNGSMTFDIRLGLTGVLQPHAFESAVSCAIRMHPFLSANICLGDSDKSAEIPACQHAENSSSSESLPGPQDIKPQHAKSRWVAARNPQPYVSIAPKSESLRYPVGESIDLLSEVGVRVWARHDDEQSELRFQFHHACCDGLGAMKLIEDVLCFYHQSIHGPTDPSPRCPHDVAALSIRTAEPEQKLAIGYRILRATVILPIRISKLFAQRPDPIATSSVATCPPKQTNQLQPIPCHVFGKELTESLTRSARACGATLNDLLVRDFFLTLNEWNQSHNSQTNRLIRVMIPFSLRTQKHVRMPAANCVSMVYMAATAKMLKNPKRLLASVTGQRKFIRKWHIEHSWNQTAGLIASSPRIAKLTRRSVKRRIATSVLSNLGRVFYQSGFPETNGEIQCGNLVLNSVVMVPPTDASTTLTVGCNLYAERLTVAMNYHRQQFAESDATQFLKLFVKRLQNYSESGQSCEA